MAAVLGCALLLGCGRERGGAVDGGADGAVDGGADGAVDGGADGADGGGAVDGCGDAATDGGGDAATDGGGDGGAAQRVHLEIADAGVEKGEASALANALELARPALRACIELWGRPDQGGQAELEVSLDPKERSAKVRITSKERLGRDVRGCLERVMRRTDFGAGDGKALVRVTVRWEPG
jgi:hypothetical protein